MIFRVLYFLFVYVPFMLIFCPIQYVWTKLKAPGWHAIPMIFHQLGAAFIGLKVTVIGEPVNLAARLQSAASPNHLLTLPACLADLPYLAAAATRRVVTLRGLGEVGVCELDPGAEQA